jgi:hypothetical protein
MVDVPAVGGGDGGHPETSRLQPVGGGRPVSGLSSFR